MNAKRRARPKQQRSPRRAAKTKASGVQGQERDAQLESDLSRARPQSRTKQLAEQEEDEFGESTTARVSKG